MKKLICVLLSVLMLLSVSLLVSCDKAEPTLKMGLGVYTSTPSVTDATTDDDGKAVDGQGKVAITAAVITVDADGKVVACQLDTAENTVKYTGEGKAVSNDGFKTKYEQGTDYNMVAWGGAAKEWFEQADAFETVVVGKTLSEIKALVAADNKGNSDVVTAGCTIMIHEFVGAIEKAFANLADSTATASSTLKLGMHTEQTVKDASTNDEGQVVNGSNKVETTIFAAAVDAEGKVLVAASDCVQVDFTFNEVGASTFDTTKAVVSKREAGANYNMVAWGGAAKEWFEQADAFNALCVGKTATEIKALCAADNYGTDEVKTAGCTILVNGFVKAAAKIG